MLIKYFGNIVENFEDDHIAVDGDDMLWTTKILILILFIIIIPIAFILDILLYPLELIINYIQRKKDNYE